jgi:2-haloacid dehalogenase
MNPTPSPTIVFDLGGVLLDWNARHLYIKLFSGDTVAMEKFLAEVNFPAWNARFDGGHPLAEGIAELSSQFPHYADQIRAFQPRWQETIVGPIWPTVGILQRLKQAGYPLFALSNWSAETYPIMQARYEFLSWFEKVVISGEVGSIKPDEHIFHVFLEIAGRPAGDCLFIDDSEANIATAGRLGFQTIRFLSPEQLESELSARKILR